MKIKSVTIEGMHKVVKKTYDLTDFTYFYGKNGVGKSTVLGAIQLGLLGYIPGTAKTAAGIFRHANNHTMAITLNIDDNGSPITVQRIWQKARSSVSSTVNVIPEGYEVESIISSLELPIFNFGEFMSLSANKLKDWFISYLSDNSAEVKYEELFADILSANSDEEFLSTIKEEFKKNANGVDGVRNLNASLKSMLSYAKSEQTRLLNTLQSLVHYDDVEDVGDPNEVKIKIKDMEDQIARIQQNALIKQSNETVRRNLEAFKDLATTPEEDRELQEYKSEVIGLDRMIEQNRVETSKLSAKIAECDAEIRGMSKILASNSICPYTNSFCDSIQSMRDEFQKKSDGLAKIKADTAAKLEKLSAESTKILTRQHTARAQLAERENQYARRKFYEGQLKAEDSTLSVYDVESIKVEIERLRDNVAKAYANTQYNELVDTVTNSRYRIELNINTLNALIKATDVNGLQDSMMKEPFINLALDMTKYIQKFFGNSEYQAGFNLESKANTFSFGLIRDGVYIPYDMLSSGEKCVYLFAFMLCIIQKSDSPLKLMMVDDMLDHLDDDKVERLFKSLNSVKGVQIILAGVQKCNSENTSINVQELK